jgi:spore cortex formation protein SpoVR/YcgB (stage V sporulation)
MMQDIERICTNPTDEDRNWFPSMAGNNDPMGTLRDAWANHRDESFILQYLSPALIRKLRMFVLNDVATQPHYQVASIHDERGYAKIRATLAHNYDIGTQQPNIQVVDVDLLGNRHLRLQHMVHDGVVLSEESRDATLRHIRRLWGYDVSLIGIDDSGSQLYEAAA